MKVTIVPAILAANLQEFKAKLNKLEPFFSLIQVDVLDNSLIKNKSYFDLKKIVSLNRKINYELHLMVAKPEPIIRRYQSFPQVKRFIVHYESFGGREAVIYDIIKKLKAAKKQLYLAVNPATRLADVEPLLPLFSGVLLMGVEPGWSGQKFISKVLAKIRQVRKKFPKLHIAVDGGVTMKNIAKIVTAGADIINTASLINQLEDPAKELPKLKKQLKFE